MAEELFRALREIAKCSILGKMTFIQKNVKKTGCSGAVYLPKRYIGKEAMVIIIEND